jgi:hypothetical protein
MSSRPLRKKFKYRDISGATREEHAAHWRGFTFRAGPVVVRAYGPWGQLQVWAEDEDEAYRVIRHACDIGGWNFDEQLERVEVGRTKGSRNGRTGTMQTKETPLGVEVTKRDGPSGFPVIG